MLSYSVVSANKSADETTMDAMEEMTFSRANFGLFQEEEPGKKATEALFRDFFEVWTDNRDPENSLRMVEKFEELCSDQISIMQKILQRSGPGGKFGKTLELEEQMRMEKCCWRLLRQLYESRLAPQEPDLPKLDLMFDGNVAENLRRTDRVFRELQIIVDWAQQNTADKQLDSLNPNPLKTFQWEVTLHRMKVSKQKSGRLDPDAPLRNPKCLDQADAEDENRLLYRLLYLIRCGQLDKAVELCVIEGCAWRAATLQGGLLHLDPNLRRGAGESLAPVSGNPNRRIWKALCWKMADEKSLSTAERAIYGSLSGRLSAMLPLCPSWEDRLWALGKATAESRLDAALGNGRSNSPLSPIDNNSDLNLEDIFDEIAKDERLQSEVRNPYRAIEKLLIVDKPSEAVELMFGCVEDRSGAAPSKHLVRFFAHLVLVFRQLQFQLPTSLSDRVLEEYVGVLSEDDRGEELPFYAALLPGSTRIKHFACYLSKRKVLSEESRKRSLELAQAAGLDTVELCLAVVDQTRARLPLPQGARTNLPSVDSSMAEATELAEALEWLLVDERMRVEALAQTNAIAKQLMASEQSSSAAEVLRRIPSHLPDLIRANWAQCQSPDIPIPSQFSFVISEFNCLSAYLTAQETFSEWFEYSGKRRPMEEEEPAESFEWTARTLAEQRRKQFQVELRKWETYAEAAVRSLWAVVEFPGGWLQFDTEAEDDVDVEWWSAFSSVARQQREREKLREIYLPLTVNMLNYVYRSLGTREEVWKLADHLASKDNNNFAFAKESMKVVLKDLLAASLESLHAETVD